MLFIGNICFRRKIVYHNKMHLHYPSLKKRLAPSLIKSRTHVFKKVSVTALDYAYGYTYDHLITHMITLDYGFPNFDKSVLITKIKASIL